MKNIVSILFTAGLLVCVACNFSAGTKKDLVTGLSYSFNGFTVDDVILAGPDNTALSNNKVPFNTKVAIIVQGLGNYTLKDDKAFPGLSIKVTDAEGVALIDEADLFADGNGYSTTDAANIRGSVNIGDPMKSGQTYQVKMRVWDKNKPENELKAEVEIVVE